MPDVQWTRRDDGALVPTMEGKDVVWAPQPGSQEAFLDCPLIECLLEGNRGGGKSDVLLMDFAQHVGQGYGPEWKGYIFRKTCPQLGELIDKACTWFPKIWPSSTFNKSTSTWHWSTGEKLMFRYMERDKDYDNYHGHNIPWIGFDELTTWATPKAYTVMLSILRSSRVDMPRKLRATCNPAGVGHNWVKLRFDLPVPPGRVIGPVIKNEGEPARAAVHSSLDENRVMLNAEPDYQDRIQAAARNPGEAAAWLEGSWDIAYGGMFDDLWTPRYHVLPPFEIPQTWQIDRAFDWGSSKPFSVGWWAESDGSDVQLPNGNWASTVRGDLFRILEWYGCTGNPNEGLRMLATDIAAGIVERELANGLYGRVRPGPADGSIFNVENGVCIATDMRKPVRVNGQVYNGLTWLRADKRKGSRVQGWEAIRRRLRDSIPGETPREHPGLFVFETCRDFIRTMPTLPRAVDKNPDDVDTDAEDHIADETRYRVRYEGRRGRVMKSRGLVR